MNSRLPTPFRGLRRRLAERAAESDIWDAVQLARDDGRPYTLDYAGHLVDDWIEVHGDRAGTDDHAIVDRHRLVPRAHDRDRRASEGP